MFAKNEKTELAPKERNALKKVLPQVVQDYKDYGTKPLWDFIVDRSDRCRQEVLSCN
jgi:hypothetical protein